MIYRKNRSIAQLVDTESSDKEEKEKEVIFFIISDHSSQHVEHHDLHTRTSDTGILVSLGIDYNTSYWAAYESENKYQDEYLGSLCSIICKDDTEQT